MPSPAVSSRLAPKAATAIRAAIRLAGGREVCFVCNQDPEGILQTARVVARGDVASVLALPGFATRGEMLVHNHPSGLLEPSAPDLEIAARIHDDGVGFGIVNNDASDLYVVVEIPASAELSPLDTRVIDNELGPSGPVAAAHARYEDRPTQRAMAAEVARVYNEGGVGVFEAGTGVGKSLGYLVPALRWAAANGERTVVSTNTINLQEQLVGKDLPFLERALADQKVRFALLKGWHNYICLNRLEQARGSGASLFEDGTQAELKALSAWAARTSDGSLSDLTTAPRPEVWDEVAAEPDLCQRTNCSFYDRCFLFRARKQAAQADVIVVNHHLLLSDVAVRRASGNWGEAAVLPAYGRLIVDEGHHLEDAAATHLGQSVSRRAVQRLTNRLERRGKGLMPALFTRLAASNDLLSTASRELMFERLGPAVTAVRDKSTVLFDLLEAYLKLKNETVLRLTDAFAEDPIWKAGLRVALENTLGEMSLLDDGLTLVRERLETVSASDESVASLLSEMRAVTRRLQNVGDGLRNALDPPPGLQTVRWAELKGRDRGISVSAVPLDLAPILREDLFKRVASAVVTSATLATDGKFDFLASRLGLTDEVEPSTGIFASPFDFTRNAILAIPTDIPAPNVDGAGHMAAVARIVVEFASASRGGMFVLFTSHRDVKAMATELRSRGFDRQWPLMVHGEDTRDALLGRFRDAGNGVLLGTSSFWEGVDVPGDPLRALLIAKLPFRVPTEPITAAHSEAINARGGDAFKEYMLPHAALRLKQGFGRLIRSTTDRGVVVITDPRLTTKAYGRDLLRGLPPAKQLTMPWLAALPRIQSFYLIR